MVCQECGINIGTSVRHAPGCSQYTEVSDHESGPETTESRGLKAVLSIAAERGAATATSLERGVPEEIGDPIANAAWCGAFAFFQVLLEQDLINKPSFHRFIVELGN